jgi:hypothetical protein
LQRATEATLCPTIGFHKEITERAVYLGFLRDTGAVPYMGKRESQRKNASFCGFLSSVAAKTAIFLGFL